MKKKILYGGKIFKVLLKKKTQSLGKNMETGSVEFSDICKSIITHQIENNWKIWVKCPSGCQPEACKRKCCDEAYFAFFDGYDESPQHCYNWYLEFVC